MLNKKNEQIKAMRKKLSAYEPNSEDGIDELPARKRSRRNSLMACRAPSLYCILTAGVEQAVCSLVSGDSPS
ncbi:hypothetical protein E2C01_039409 [Portunus trituberculatus]|uniref:Uncharacterized protein n=1 Tax=Portunus trituberculatus TaxID=210409 RepID=A0A5B7FKL9_PORTR|nr:hypothetical protein [Portunus trituberculatus]